MQQPRDRVKAFHSTYVPSSTSEAMYRYEKAWMWYGGFLEPVSNQWGDGASREMTAIPLLSTKKSPFLSDWIELGFSFHRSWVPGLWPNPHGTFFYLKLVAKNCSLRKQTIQGFTENENFLCYWEAIQGNGLNTNYKQEFSFFWYAIIQEVGDTFIFKFSSEARVHSFFPGKNNWFESSSPLSKGKSATCHQTHGVDEPATIEFLPSDLSGLSF